MSDTATFFQTLYGTLNAGESIELRMINAGDTRRSFYQSIEGAAQAALRSTDSANVFFGVATRDGKGGKKANLVRIPAVWADLDDGNGLDAPTTRLDRSPLCPSAVVSSGTGLQAYWLLTESAAAAEAARIEHLNKAIAVCLDGDGVADASRVLRVPGTRNLKYEPPKDVTVMANRPDLRYTVDELEQAFGSPPSGVAATGCEPPSPTTQRAAELPCRSAIWRGVDEGYRDNACYQLAVDLKRQGMPRDVAVRSLTDWNKLNSPPLDLAELQNTVSSVYSTDYAGLGCDKYPMRALCQPDCPVKCRNNPCTVHGQPDAGQDSEVPPLGLWTWKALLNRDTTPPEFVVDGLIPRRGVTMLTGEGGIGKSFWVIELAYAVATGSDFLHHFPCVQGAVLLLDLENDEGTIARRIQKITAGRREEEDTPDDLPVHINRKLDMAAMHFHINQEAARTALCNCIESVCPSLLVIDPLVAVHSRDENDNMAMRSVIMALQDIARLYNLAVVVIHHPRKRGMYNDPGQMIRGASDLRNAVDSHLFLRRACGDCVIVEHDKSRHAPPVEKFTVEMLDNESGTATYIRHTGEVTASLEKEAAARECLLSILEESGEVQRKELLARAEAEGVRKSTAERALSSLQDDKRVTKVERGRYSLADQHVELEM